MRSIPPTVVAVRHGVNVLFGFGVQGWGLQGLIYLQSSFVVSIAGWGIDPKSVLLDECIITKP